MALLNALYKMQQMGQWCDVHLITASGQIIKSHACILSAASSTLEEMINLGSSDPITMIKTVLLPSGVDFKTMEILIQYIYTSNDIVRFRNQSKGKKIPTKDVTDKIINVGSLIGIELFETTSRVATENEKLKHNEENPTAVKEQKKRRSNAGNTRPRRNRRNTSNSEEHTFSSGEVPSPVHHADMDCAKVDEHTSPTFSCDECGKQFKQRKAWQLHMDEIHSPGKNICSFCQKSFATQQKLDRHIQRHRNRTTCTICNKSFTNDYVMQLHLRTHTGQERFSCHICEKKFPYKSSLTTHLLIHSDKKAYICSVCGKSFRQKIHAKEHESQHSGVKRYQCSDCSKSFAHRSGLMRHINDIHQKIRPFICESCGRSFSRKVKLTEHRRIHTGEKPYVCSECGTSYKSNRSLKNHKKSRHGIIVPEYVTGIWKQPSQRNEKKKVAAEECHPMTESATADIPYTVSGCVMPLKHSPLVAINQDNLFSTRTTSVENHIPATAITNIAEEVVIPPVVLSSAFHLGQRGATN